MASMRFIRLTMFVSILALLASAADKKPVRPTGSSTAGPYTPGIVAGETLYVSGTTGTNPKTGKIPESFEDEVRQTLDNINLVLREAGYSFEDAVAVQVYLTDMSLFPRMNKVYMEVLPEPRPARTTVGVASLVGTAKIEITVTAWKRQGRQ